MIKALFFDIDGTLVSFETHQIPASTIRALEEAKAQGVKVFIATGRPIPLINNLGAIEHLIDGYITTNGACCIVDGKVIFINAIPETDCQTLIRISDERGIPTIFVGEKNLVVYHPDKEVEHIFYDYLHAPRLTEADPRELMRHERITQITPFFTEAIEQEVMPLIPGCISGRWYPAFCDITAIGSDKGNGIRHIAKHFGFGIEETMAFGDGGNDISMIKVAGIGVAMGNANESLKPVADYITSSVDEDGVEKAMREFGVMHSPAF